MQPAADHISIREKICYGLGDSSANIFFGMTMMFLPYFYTDVVGLTASAMGALFLIARLVDAFSDPIIGNFADRHETKHGHYRPFLLYLAIPYGLSCFLVFLAPDLSYTGKLIYAFVTYIFLILMYASTVVPYVGLLSVLTDNPAERLSINSYRFPLAKSAFLLCSAVVPMFVATYDKAHEAQAYSHAMIIIGILAACCTLACFFGTKERSHPLIVKDENDTLFSKIKIIAKTRTLRSFYIFFALTQAAFTFKGSSAIYYAKYYLAQNDAYLTGHFIGIFHCRHRRTYRFHVAHPQKSLQQTGHAPRRYLRRCRNGRSDSHRSAGTLSPVLPVPHFVDLLWRTRHRRLLGFAGRLCRHVPA